MRRRGAPGVGSRLLLAALLACCGALLCSAQNVDENNSEPCTNLINGVTTDATTTEHEVARRSLRGVVTTVVGCKNVVNGYGATVHGNGNVLADNRLASSMHAPPQSASRVFPGHRFLYWSRGPNTLLHG